MSIEKEARKPYFDPKVVDEEVRESSWTDFALDMGAYNSTFPETSSKRFHVIKAARKVEEKIAEARKPRRLKPAIRNLGRKPSGR